MGSGRWAGFAVGDLVELQQPGCGVALALLIDATIVGSVLVTVAMVVLGDRNWHMPSWLSWMPELSTEGAASDRAGA